MIQLPHRSTLFPYTTLFRSSNTEKKSRAKNGALTWNGITGANRFLDLGIPMLGFSKSRNRFAPVIPFQVSRSEEHTSELQSLRHLVCRLLLEKKKNSK